MVFGFFGLKKNELMGETLQYEYSYPLFFYFEIILHTAINTANDVRCSTYKIYYSVNTVGTSLQRLSKLTDDVGHRVYSM